jgi:hypothetical protein
MVVVMMMVVVVMVVLEGGGGGCGARRGLMRIVGYGFVMDGAGC